MVSALYATGGGRPTAVYCVDGNGDPLMPCMLPPAALRTRRPGPSGDDAEGVRTMAEILPQAFGPWDLVERKSLRDR